ncbi:MAG TPA: CehA/McbA family metallohydrolase [Terriglobales bacterium]|nr:CehA/McbA family metallohydrolase [Terriglobales bacterium]
MTKGFRSLSWLLLLVLGLVGARSSAQIPTAYPIATPNPDKQLQAAGQMYMEGLYLPSVTRGPWNPTWSPSGEEIAFGMHGSIWKVSAQGGDAIQVTSGPHYDSQPAWSPDGRSIAFSRDDGHSMHIWVVRQDGSSPQQLTHGAGINVDPEWQSANLIYYTSSPGGKPLGLWQVPARGGTPSPLLADGKQSLQPASSPDGKSYVFISARPIAPGLPASYGSGDLWKVDLATKVPHLLLRQETLWAARPRWSPDGKTIVLVSQQTGRNQLFLADAKTGIPAQLTYSKDEVFTPAWSPKGDRIAFISNGDHKFTLLTMPAAGGEATPVKIAALRWKEPAGTLRVSVEDPSGNKTAARIYLTGNDGKSWAPDGAFERVSIITGDHYFQSAGDFTVELPAGKAIVEAAKGFQYRPQKREVEITAGQTQTVTLKLERIADLQANGWYSGDNHLHMNYGGVYAETPESLLSEADAEDLNVVNDFPTNHNTRLIDVEYFTGKPDTHSSPNRILYFNEEYRPNFAGHMGLLNMKRFYFPVYDGYDGTPYAAEYPTNAQVLDAMHEQGAIGGYVHPYLLSPGGDPLKTHNFVGAREFPADVALGKTDFYDLMCIWTDANVAGEVLYRLWNLGYRIPVSAGSDAMPNYWRAPTIGGVRVYVHSESPLNYQGWIDGLVKGKSFVTNGPLMTFKVDGHEPGDEVQISGEKSSVPVEVEVNSIVPVERLDIIQNGQVVASEKAADPYHIKISKAVPVASSGWIAARVSGPAKVHLITDSYVYAHSNPVWLTRDGQKPSSPKDAQYFVQWMDSALQLVPQRTFYTPQQKAETVAVYQKAREKFLEMSGAGAPGK